MGSAFSILRLLFNPNPSVRDYCILFKRLAIVYLIFTLFMIYSAYTTFTNFRLYYPTFAQQIAIISGLQALSYLLKSISLWPLGNYNDIFTITKAKVTIAFLFSVIALIMLIIRYAYELRFFAILRAQAKENNDDAVSNVMTHQIVVLAVVLVIISFTNGSTLITVFQFYNKLDRFKLDAQNDITSATAVSINPVRASAPSAPYRI